LAESSFDAADLSVLKNKSMIIGGRRLEWGSRTFVMGVLNITPDSFSGDGLFTRTGSKDYQAQANSNYVEAALEQARSFVKAGVDILDVGGESTRPGSQPTSLEEESKRVVPVIRALAAELDILISIDSYKAPVAQAALDAGAHMINDVWGLRADPNLGSVAANYAVPMILMHNRSSWAHAEIKAGLGGRYIGMEYENLLTDIQQELLESVEMARSAGVSEENIIIDPGIGFGKTVEQNLELINRLNEIRALGYPVLLGPSRKSFIGYTLDLPPDQRLEGTAAAVAVGIVRGADIVRVHDVQPIVRVVRMTDAIVRNTIQTKGDN
jgi:dihydropteroate synthase